MTHGLNIVDQLKLLGVFQYGLRDFYNATEKESAQWVHKLDVKGTLYTHVHSSLQLQIELKSIPGTNQY